jgi:hypothetical protein
MRSQAGIDIVFSRFDADGKCLSFYNYKFLSANKGAGLRRTKLR